MDNRSMDNRAMDIRSMCQNALTNSQTRYKKSLCFCGKPNLEFSSPFMRVLHLTWSSKGVQPWMEPS